MVESAIEGGMRFWNEWLIASGCTVEHASFATAVAALMCLGIILTGIRGIFK